MDSMKKELMRFRNLINDTRNSKDYQRVEKIAEERVNATLQDKKSNVSYSSSGGIRNIEKTS